MQKSATIIVIIEKVFRCRLRSTRLWPHYPRRGLTLIAVASPDLVEYPQRTLLNTAAPKYTSTRRYAVRDHKSMGPALTYCYYYVFSDWSLAGTEKLRLLRRAQKSSLKALMHDYWLPYIPIIIATFRTAPVEYMNVLSWTMQNSKTRTESKLFLTACLLDVKQEATVR